MSEQNPPRPPEGQTPETKAWVARRDAAMRAAEADRARAAQDRAIADRRIEQSQRRAGPMPLIAGIVLLLCLLLGALWLFLDRLTCDPMWSDKGLGSYCKPPPQ